MRRESSSFQQVHQKVIPLTDPQLHLLNRNPLETDMSKEKGSL